jgi:hypothetical protein
MEAIAGGVVKFKSVCAHPVKKTEIIVLKMKMILALR